MIVYLWSDIFLNASPEDLLQKLWHLGHLRRLQRRYLFCIEADQTPGHHYPCAAPSQVGRGGASLPPDSVLFRFNSYLKNLISFTGCTVDITHSRALLTTCKSQRLQQSSTMQLMSGSSVCHQKRTKGIEAKESKVICTSSPMLHEGKHESEFAAVCKYFQNTQKGNLPLQS